VTNYLAQFENMTSLYFNTLLQGTSLGRRFLFHPELAKRQTTASGITAQLEQRLSVQPKSVSRQLTNYVAGK
jgi:hypothetical protein